MREIKFRAWHKPFKSTKFGSKYIYGTKAFDFWDMSPEDYTLEQFTGLHDKNGREIYDGDIVKLHVVILSPDYNVGVIEYSPEFGYCINFRKSIAPQEYWAGNDKYTIEVIGNIHENPELLEDVSDN
ncbi:YopX family protein [Fructobacillus fructosus]|uniref:YopX family protein n=1 Tax=Fructobacillus fructosus TaxID=1631 RepID=UPI0040333C9E